MVYFKAIKTAEVNGKKKQSAFVNLRCKFWIYFFVCRYINIQFIYKVCKAIYTYYSVLYSTL